MRTACPPDFRVAERFAKTICLLLLMVPLVAGALSVSASWIPFSFLAAKARTMSVHGQSSFLDQTFYREIQFRLRLIGLGNVALAGTGIAFRERIYQIIHRIFTDFVVLGKDVKSAVLSIPRIDVVGLSGLTLFAGLLRFPYLFQPMRGDEAYTFLTYASHPFYVALSFYNTPNNHIFHTLLMRLSYLVFGNHPWALRLPVFVAGLCVIPATYIAGRCLYGRDSGLLAAGLVASASPLIEYSTNARGHILICLEFVVLIPVAVYALQLKNSAAWTVVAVIAALGFYTEPIMLYPFGSIVVWLFISILTGNDKFKWETIKRLVLVAAVAAAITIELYAPVFAVSGPGAFFASKVANAKVLPRFLGELPASLATTWWQWNRDVPWWLEAVLTAGFFAALFLHRRVNKEHVPLALSIVLWVAPLVLLSRVVPPARVWLFALPLYLIVASAGCSLVLVPILDRLHIRQGVVIFAMLATLLVGIRGKRSGSVYLENEGRGMEQVVVYLKGQLKPGDSVVAVVPSDTLLLYHFREHSVPFSYLNAPDGDHVFVIVNEQKGDTLHTVLTTAQRANLEDEPSTLVAKYETVSLYEISAQQRDTSLLGSAGGDAFFGRFSVRTDVVGCNRIPSDV